MKPTLLIMAAGMGSRYGGMKQTDEFGPNGETILEYSLYDAIKAGFGKVVFIIKEENLAIFKSKFENKLTNKIEVSYAFQGVQDFVPSELGILERTKPWGTGHAMLCAKNQTNTPFAIINADDFYGYEAFKIMADFLSTDTDSNTHSMVAYQLYNTISDYGTVSRGVCEKNEAGNLENVTERTEIYPLNNKIVYKENEIETELPEKTPVSMNFWGFKTNIFEVSEELFKVYAKNNYTSAKAEFYLPSIVSHVIANNIGVCKVFESQSPWFGVTYKEDKPIVQQEINTLIEKGVYPSHLWN
ncbi:MAG: nucleotidyltransferase [Pseudarcicella sp.]|nr:nucleotidyltransferase [Pseudarcicella sp.]